jgi:hypothetical protein
MALGPLRAADVEEVVSAAPGNVVPVHRASPAEEKPCRDCGLRERVPGLSYCSTCKTRRARANKRLRAALP